MTLTPAQAQEDGVRSLAKLPTDSFKIVEILHKGWPERLMSEPDGSAEQGLSQLSIIMIEAGHLEIRTTRRSTTMITAV